MVNLDSTADAERRDAQANQVANTMSANGLRVDLPMVTRRIHESDRRRTDLRSQLLRDYGFPAETSDGRLAANPLATAAGKQYLPKLVAGTSWPLEADGHPAVDRASLHRVIAGGEEEDLRDLAAIIDELQSPTTFLNEVARCAHGERVHPIYGSDTATGRWTSTRPNVLGAGRRTGELLAQRDVVLAEPGHRLIGVDLAGIDARCVAGLSGDRAYADLVTGSDPHSAMALRFFGSAEHRSAAKAITHGLNYGRGAESIARETGKPLPDIEHLMNGYFEAYPDLAGWQDRVRRIAGSDGRLPTGTGRFVAVNPSTAYTAGPARVAQAAARDLALVGLLRLVEAGLLPFLRLFLHDEVVLSVPEAQARDMVADVAALMSFQWRSPSGLLIPIDAVPHEHVGRRWSDLYSVPESGPA